MSHFINMFPSEKKCCSGNLSFSSDGTMTPPSDDCLKRHFICTAVCSLSLYCFWMNVWSHQQYWVSTKLTKLNSGFQITWKLILHDVRKVQGNIYLVHFHSMLMCLMRDLTDIETWICLFLIYTIYYSILSVQLML